MKFLVKSVGVLVVSVTTLLGAPAPIYFNPGVNPDPIMVDATIFYNTGTFNIGTPPDIFLQNYLNPVTPFETQNTLFYTNTFSMTAIPGFNLEFIDDGGVRRPAAQIYNGPGATISGGFANLSIDISGFPDELHPLYGGFVSLNATNIINRGSISGFYAGAIEIRGKNVDLSGSKVGNAPLNFSTFSTFFYTPNDTGHSQQSFATRFGPEFFSPETDIRDIWWRYGLSGINPNNFAAERITPNGETNLIVNTGRFGIYTQIVDGASLESTDPPFSRLSLLNPDVYVWTNQPSATNKLIEIVFLDHFDTNVLVDVTWQPGGDPNLPSQAAYVRFTTIQPDLVSQGVSSVANQFVIVDNLGPNPLPQLLINSLTLDTQAPTNLFAFRAYPPNFIPGVPIGQNLTNSSFSPLLLTTWFDDVFTDGMEMTNQVTTNLYATWAGRLQPFPSDILNDGGFIFGGLQGSSIFDRFGITPVPGASITNVAGRVAIDAGELNLRNARIQGQGMVSIRTDNLKSSRGAVIDAPILNYDLGATNGRLEIKDLAKGSVTRFGGSFFIWSTTFTNSFELAGTSGSVTNGTDIDLDGDGVSDGCDTNGDGTIDETTACTVEAGTDSVTNYVAVYHVTVIQNSLNSGGRSFINDLRLRATNVDIQDQIVVDGTFSTTAENLTLSGNLNLIGITNLTGVQVPRLNNLTNSGTLSVPSFIGLGLPPSSSIRQIINSGSLEATAVTLNSQRIVNSGTILAQGGDLLLTATEFINNGGSLNTVRNVVLSSVDADLSGLAGTVGGSITLNVTGTLKDGGVDFPGFVQTTYGINLPAKPPIGDLPGTTFTITAPDFVEVQSFWAGEDLGRSRNGFTNNASIGVLALDIEVGGVITFSPMGEKNAIYVERLELSDVILPDLENNLNLQEGMTLYYASTSDNIDPADLDGTVTVGGGTLIWVEEGSNPSVVLVDVASGDGRILRVPKSLRFSTTLDSDSDGVANASDSSPFDLVVVSQVSLVAAPVSTFEIQWNAAAGQTYEVQFNGNLSSSNWVPLRALKNASNVSQRLTVQDPVDPQVPLKAYRVVVKP